MKKFDAITITCSALEFVTIVELCVASINRKGLSDRKKKFSVLSAKGSLGVLRYIWLCEG